jgi:methionine sulfoxide reductase heme-binding subunit
MYTNALWYLSRGTGVVCLVLFSVVVALGIATRSGRELPGLPRFAVTAVHRNASVFALVLLVIHIGGLLFDPYAQLKLVDVVIPFTGAYRPLWLGFGTLAFDLVIALIVTSLLRHRIGRRAFKAVHWTAYAMWPLAALHGLGNGTDSGRLWLRLVLVACTALVLAAVIWRLTPAFAEYTKRRTRVPTVAPPGPPTTPLRPAPARREPVPARAPVPVHRTPGPVAPPPTYLAPTTPRPPAQAPATRRPAQGSAPVPRRNDQWNGQWTNQQNTQQTAQWPGQPATQPTGQPTTRWNGQQAARSADPRTARWNGQAEGWR